MAHDEEHGMTIPNQLSLEALLEEEGPVSAGLPIPLRPADDKLRAAQEAAAKSQERRERLNRLMAEITVQENRLKELHRELSQVVRETLDHWR